MKKRFPAVLLAFLLLTACAAPAGPDPAPAGPAQSETREPAASEPESGPELSQREQNWRDDLNFLRDEYKQIHTDPFIYCSEEEFDWKFDQLIENINDLTDNDIYFEMTAIIAGMGDNHTAVMPPVYDRLFPVGVRYFGDKLYLVAYQEEYAQFAPCLLREIVAVNGVDISYLQRKAERLNSGPGFWNGKEWFAGWYFIPNFFDWVDCDYKEGYTLQILNENQEVVSLELPALDPQIYAGGTWISSEIYQILPYLKDGNRTEYVQEEDGDFIYLALFDLSSTFDSRYQSLFEEANGFARENPDCDTLVIDLRRNIGGYFSAVDSIRRHIRLLKIPSIAHTYVITEGYVTSAAIDCLGIFKEELNAVSVGEPTGQFSSYFSKPTSETRTLPNSQVPYNISGPWHDGPEITAPYYDETGNLYEWENTILPDVYVHQDIEDIRQGRDSVIQWILSQ